MIYQKEKDMVKVGLLFAQGTEECEALNVADILRRAGMELSIISVDGAKKVTGSHDITIMADETIEEHNFLEDEVLVIPGGMPGTNNIEQNPVAKQAIDDLYKAGKYVCAICAAPKILGHGGYLDGKKACIYPGLEGELTGAEVCYEEVVRDGNIITSRGLGTAIPFALEIISSVQGKDRADEMAKKIVFRV